MYGSGGSSASGAAAGEAEAANVEPGEAEAANVEGGEAEAKADSIEEPPIAEAEASDVPVPYTLAGVGEKTVRKLVEAGFTTQEDVAAATVERLSEVPGIGGKTAEKILAAARGEAATAREDV